MLCCHSRPSRCLNSEFIDPGCERDFAFYFLPLLGQNPLILINIYSSSSFVGGGGVTAHLFSAKHGNINFLKVFLCYV